jgi:hypothetical protein
VQVANVGTYRETSIPVHFKIESLGTTVYNQSVTLPALDSAASDSVVFPNWTSGPGGSTYQVTAWHSYSPDTNRANDTMYRTVVVRGHDLATTATNLTGRVRSGQPVAPTITITDVGDYNEFDFNVYCLIDSAGTRVYTQMVPVDSVALGTPRTFTFPNWTPGPDSFVYDVTVYHNLVGDEVHRNDTLHSTVATRGHGISSVSMNISGRVRGGVPFTPGLTIQSADYTEHNVTCKCWIDSAGTRIYDQTAVIDSVIAGANALASFPTWNVGPAGTQYSVTMFNTFPDANQSDDTLRRTTEAVDQLRVLVAYADVGGRPDSLIRGLTDLGDSIELYDAASATPTLAGLTPYDGVITFSDNTFNNPTAMGDTLAAYVDLGKPVVIGTFALTTGWAVAGRIMTGNYAAMNPGANNHVQGSLGWFNASHPIMAGVTTVTDLYRSGTSWATGSDSVAKWADNAPYVATSANMQVVAINNYPGYVNPSRLTGRDWVKVYHQALLWASGGGTGLEEKQPFSISPDFSLCRSMPNPMSERTVISYSLPCQVDVNLVVYDLSGRAVATLAKGRQNAGWHNVTWNRTDGQGKRVASGVYFYKLTSGSYQVTRKLVVE